MEKITVSDWDAAEYIETKEGVMAYLETAMNENDPEFLLSAIGDIARSKGIAEIARELNLDRTGLYRSFSPDGNPSFIAVLRILENLGFRLKVEQKIPA
jgi:probable addiction module antidote protein